MSAVTNTLVTGTAVRRASGLVTHSWPCPGTCPPRMLPEEGLLALVAPGVGRREGSAAGVGVAHSGW